VHRSETEQRLEGCHGLPTAIVPKDELVQIDLQLGAANPVVSAYEPLLEVADGDQQEAPQISLLDATRFSGG